MSACCSPSRKYAASEFGSMVVPDLLARMYSVRFHRRVDGEDRRRVGRVEHVETQPARRSADHRPQDFGGEARAAHAQENGVSKALVLDPFCKFVQPLERIGHQGGRVEPAEAVGDRLVHLGIGRPDRRVTLPQSSYRVRRRRLVRIERRLARDPGNDLDAVLQAIAAGRHIERWPACEEVLRVGHDGRIL